MRVLSAVVVLLAFSASDALAQARPPGLRPDPSSVEAGLWDRSEEMEMRLRTGGRVIEDEALNRYVRDVTCRLAPEYCDELRVYVTNQPALNATVTPNGMIDIWSGLLLRATNEDELAFVLGHEVSHYAENHTIERWNQVKTTMSVTMAISVGVGAAGAYYGVDTSGFIDLAYYGAMAAIFSYGRGHENQADELGLARAVAAGYDPSAGVRLWQSAQAETAASDFPTVRRREAWGSAFRSHPLTSERIDNLRRLANGRTGADAPDRHRAAIRPHLAAWLRDDLRRRDFGQTLSIIDRLGASGEDAGVLEFFRGEVYRIRRTDGDLERARASYQRAIEFPDAPAEAWRELGEINRRLGDRDSALAAFQEYLERAPGADDLWLVEDAITSLGET